MTGCTAWESAMDVIVQLFMYGCITCNIFVVKTLLDKCSGQKKDIRRQS
jgi:hypothetical protein